MGCGSSNINNANPPEKTEEKEYQNIDEKQDNLNNADNKNKNNPEDINKRDMTSVFFFTLL